MWFSFNSSVSKVSNYGIWIRAARLGSVFREHLVSRKRRKRSSINVKFGEFQSKKFLFYYSDVILIEVTKIRIDSRAENFYEKFHFLSILFVLQEKKKYRKLKPSIVRKFYNSTIFTKFEYTNIRIYGIKIRKVSKVS